MKKKILFIAHDVSLFGANQSLINIISSMANHNVEMSVVFPKLGPICEKFDELKLNYYVVNFKTELYQSGEGLKVEIFNILRFFLVPIINFFAILKLSKIVQSQNINIIHSNSSVIAIGSELASRNNLKHVWHLREYIDLDHQFKVIGGIEKLKSKIQKNSNIICISKGISRHFSVENKALVLYNAVRRESFNFKEKDNKNYYLFCGSLVKSKGIEEAIKAFHIVVNYNRTVKLLIVGSGTIEYENYLKKIITDLDLEKNVEFLGFRDDVDELMSNALGLLMCSQNEALGRVTIEAMLNKCVVIGFNNAGTSEIIEDRKTGFLFNTDSELIDLMKYFLKNRKDLNQIKENAYDFACQNFLEKQFGERLAHYYSELK